MRREESQGIDGPRSIVATALACLALAFLLTPGRALADSSGEAHRPAELRKEDRSAGAPAAPSRVSPPSRSREQERIEKLDPEPWLDHFGEVEKRPRPPSSKRRSPGP